MHALQTLDWDQIEETEHEGFALLSARETEILTWVAYGKSNTDIATILTISPHTVGTYLKRILAKLDVNSRTTAAVRAAQMGLLPPV